MTCVSSSRGNRRNERQGEHGRTAARVEDERRVKGCYVLCGVRCEARSQLKKSQRGLKIPSGWVQRLQSVADVNYYFVFSRVETFFSSDLIFLLREAKLYHCSPSIG